MKFKLGDMLICVKSQINGWTEGAEYEVKLEGGEPVLFDDEGDSWGVDFLLGWTDGRTELQFEKVDGENKMKFKTGETYICTKSSVSWFKTGKEYQVLVTDFGKLAIRDDQGTTWFDYELSGMSTYFKLKGVTEKPKFDLNNLTTAELREYVELLEDKENAEFLLECFIEKVTK